MTELGTLSVRLTATTTEFARRMRDVQDRMQGVAQAAKKVAKVSAVAFAALSVAVFKVASTFAEFELSMVRVGAVSQASSNDMKKLTASARELAAATEFSAKEVADGMGFMAMAGMDATQVIAAMPSVLQLGSAGMIDLSDAANITTNIVAGMGLELEDLARANDILVSAMTGANVDTSMLGEAFKYVGPIAKSAGVSFEETTAAISLLGNAGIQASMAGTTIRNVIGRLLNPVGEAADEIARLGLKTTDSSGRLRSLTDIVRQLEPHAEDTSAIMKIFGMRAGPGMAALLSQGSGALVNFTNRLKDSRGIAADISERVLQTFAGQMKILNSKWEEAKIAIGEGLVVPLRALNRALQWVMDAFNNLSPGVKKFVGYALFAGTALAGIVAVAAGLVAIAPAVIGALAGLAAVIGVVGGALLSIAPAMLPIIVVLAVVAAMVAFGILQIGMLKKAWAFAGDYILAVIGKIGEQWAWLGNKIADIGNKIAEIGLPVVNEIKRQWVWLGNKIGEIWQTVKTTAMQILSKLGKWILDWVNKNIGWMRDIGKAFGIEKLAGLKDIKFELDFEKGKNKLLEIADAIGGAMLGQIKTGAGFVADAHLALADTIGGQMKKGADFIVESWAEGLGIAKEALTPLVEQMKELVDTKLPEMPEMPEMPTAGGAGVGVPTDAVSTGEEVQEALKKTGKAAGRTATTAQQELSTVAGTFGNIARAFAEGGLIAGVIAIFVEALRELPVFGRYMGYVSKLLSVVGRAFAPLLRALEPLIMVLGETFGVFVQLFVKFNPLFAILVLLAPALNLLAKGMKWLNDGLVWVVNHIIDFLARWARKIPWVGDALADMIRKFRLDVDFPPGPSPSEEIKESLGGLGGAADNAAEGMRELSESMANVPSGFKVAFARFEASDPLNAELGGGLRSEMGSAAGIHVENMAVYADDPLELSSQLRDESEWQGFAGTGSPGADSEARFAGERRRS